MTMTAFIRRRGRLVAPLLAFALVVAACGGNDEEPDAATTDDGSTTDEQAVGDESIDCGEVDAEDLGGASVQIFGAFTATDATGVNAVIDECFNAPYNANARYEGSDSFEEQILIRVSGGNPPDLALFPQPGAVVEQARNDDAVALEDLGFDIADFEAVYGDYLMSLGEYEGKHYGIPASVNLKSLVWHNLPVFEAQGYEIPTTWDGLIDLSDQAVADGYTPWCIGSGSDAATGWVATDWMEDIMLRTAGPEVYDQWVSNEVRFADEPVVNAAETFAEIAFNEDFIVGATSDIPSIDFRDAVDGLVSPSAEEPTCLMHRQASFITAFFPQGTELGVDVGVFPFPEIESGLPESALIAGDYFVVFEDRPEVRAFIESFTSVGFQCATGGQDGVSRISPHVDTSADCYDDEVLSTSADLILGAVREGGARYDASDLMPPVIGSGFFWTGMNDWMRGEDLEEVLASIDAAWPDS
jgi:alpha-glucoside transport system substrate-binding protein